MPSSHTPPVPRHWLNALADVLDPRAAPRLVRLLLGALLAIGRRTVTAWLRAADAAADFRPHYTALAALGRRTDAAAARLACTALAPLLDRAPRILLGLDDTPTPRFGPHVEGAGVHHNPTPGPAGSPRVYGHVWVVLAWLARHPQWQTVALPLLARLYIRRIDLPHVPAAHRPPFRTKLELAVDLVRWAAFWLGGLNKPLWLAADGAYAARAVLTACRELSVTVVSRLRSNAALWSVPGPRPPGRRGRPRVYGEDRLDLAKRAGQRRGWSVGTFQLYGSAVARTYKTFLATWRPAGGVIRVVLVKDDRSGWAAFFCTDPTASVADVLEGVAARGSLETMFRDVKQVEGGGEQQVRRLWSNVGAWHVCLWSYTLTEAWAWERSEAEVVDRSDAPWDREPRRPSHADKRRAQRRAAVAAEIDRAVQAGATAAEIAATATRLIGRAA